MTTELTNKLDTAVLQVFGKTTLKGFAHGYVMAKALGELRELLTDEYMQPIMALQGSRLGFRTDKDMKKDGTGKWVKDIGYPIDVVRTAVIDAVLMGLQITGNQFNIIAGNMYATKEGVGAVLNRADMFPGLKKTIIVGLPHINPERTSAAFNVKINWELNGVSREEIVPIGIRMHSTDTIDMLTGKVTRKARAWLLSEIMGIEITESNIDDQVGTVVESKTGKSTEQKEGERMWLLINNAKTIQELESYKKNLPDDAQFHDAYENKMQQLKAAK